MRRFPYLLILFGYIFLSFCSEKEVANDQQLIDTVMVKNNIDSTFLPGVPVGLLANDEITEASGLVVSRSNPDRLWVNNDGGDQSRLFLIDKKGQDMGTLSIQGISNRDWEDIAIGGLPGNNDQYIFIADIGDNALQFETKYIYKVLEPDISDIEEKINLEISDVETIAFKYPDQTYNAETLILDPEKGNLYVITKERPTSQVFVLNYPFEMNEINIAKKVAELPVMEIVGGDVAANGYEMLLKTYSSIWFYEIDNNTAFDKIFEKNGKRLPYFREPQGEAIAWGIDGSGYFTLSEEPQGIEASLYYYMRIE